MLELYIFIKRLEQQVILEIQEYFLTDMLTTKIKV